MSTRTEHDALGPVEVPADKFWGAQTQRALAHFEISTELMPPEIIVALAAIKKVAALVNADLGTLDAPLASAIAEAAQQVMDGQWDSQFPLRVWQSGSGTQTNMNMNEVLAHLAGRTLLLQNASHPAVHPNDHVNHGQSSNDVFPTAIHVAAACAVNRTVVPSLHALQSSLSMKALQYKDLIKIGRTHLQDAVPLTLGQELSGYAAQIEKACSCVEHALVPVYELPIGGTAVGTGLNTHPEFGLRVVQQLGQHFKLPFIKAANPFSYIAAHDSLVSLHGALKSCAVSLMKIANDLRWMASGPRCGLGELTLPANEPGSSIMPGKINPSQCESMIMVCSQIIGNDTAMSLGGMSGNFELNTAKPLIAYNLMQSLRLLGDGVSSFNRHCVEGITANEGRIHQLLDQSLMLVTALTPYIGYDHAAKIAQTAQQDGTSLRDAAVKLGHAPEVFDEWIKPERMI